MPSFRALGSRAGGLEEASSDDLGLLRKLIGKRIAKIDRERVGLFQLNGDEFPIEAQPVTMESAWPALMGLPVSPTDAEKISHVASHVMEGLRLRLPVECVCLLTSTHLRWIPYRTYRNSEVYQDNIVQLLSEGLPIEKGIYGKFQQPLLGARSVPVQQITRISVTRFMPPDFSVIDIFLTDEADIQEPGIWPMFDQSMAGDVAPPMWLPDDPDSRYLRLSARGPSALNIAYSWSKAFDYLEMPVQLEELDHDEQAFWDELREKDRREPWRTLNQRLSN